MITMTVDSAEVERLLGGARKQMPFAFSLALNRVGEDFQVEERLHIVRSYELRRRDFVLRTVKIEKKDRATKKRLAIVIGIDANRDFLAKFEQGGRKTPRSAHRLGVPIEARRTKAGVVSKAQRIGSLNLHPEGGRIVGDKRTYKAGGFIFQRVGRGKGSKTRILWALKRSVPIPANLHFFQIALATVNARWEPRALEAVDYALKTAK